MTHKYVYLGTRKVVERREQVYYITNGIPLARDTQLWYLDNYSAY
jgi:hypothetical protein